MEYIQVSILSLFLQLSKQDSTCCCFLPDTLIFVYVNNLYLNSCLLFTHLQTPETKYKYAFNPYSLAVLTQISRCSIIVIL